MHGGSMSKVSDQTATVDRDVNLTDQEATLVVSPEDETTEIKTKKKKRGEGIPHRTGRVYGNSRYTTGGGGRVRSGSKGGNGHW